MEEQYNILKAVICVNNQGEEVLRITKEEINEIKTTRWINVERSYEE